MIGLFVYCMFVIVGAWFYNINASDSLVGKYPNIWLLFTLAWPLGLMILVIKAFLLFCKVLGDIVSDVFNK